LAITISSSAARGVDLTDIEGLFKNLGKQGKDEKKHKNLVVTVQVIPDQMLGR
jgi:hypothetical protein